MRVGEFLGRSHYKIFQIQDCLGSAGTMAAGLWEFLRDAADSKQLHTAKAAADGLMAAYIARDGFTGARQILEGAQGMAAGMSTMPTGAGSPTAWAPAGRSLRRPSSSMRRAAIRTRRLTRSSRSCRSRG